MPELSITRPIDRSLEAYKDWIRAVTEALAGGPIEDDTTPEEWEADWREFWGEGVTENKQEGAA